MAGSTFYLISTTVWKNIRGNVKNWLNKETALLCVLIIIVWSLLTIPVIVYHLPRPEVRFNEGWGGGWGVYIVDELA